LASSTDRAQADQRTLADMRGVILESGCNEQKALLRFRFWFYWMHRLQNTGLIQFCRPARWIPAAPEPFSASTPPKIAKP